MKKSGFTLVELMVVVVVLGVLAAIAIPAFVKYIAASKTTEAKENIAYLYRESTCYFAKERADPASAYVVMIPHQFPVSEGPNPPVPPAAKKILSTWDAPTWQALQFGLVDAHYYAYEYVSTGTATSSNFTAYARGDLDGDGNQSEFWRAGQANSQLEIQGTRGIVETAPLE
ncbi:MAG: prepilin-type N-terminal cleavage/methylation domain-containing protein [Pseudomonadota bacterium]